MLTIFLVLVDVAWKLSFVTRLFRAVILRNWKYLFIAYLKFAEDRQERMIIRSSIGLFSQGRIACRTF